MTKITIINCIIVAVCVVFQTAEAGLFDKSPENSLLDNLSQRITDTLGNVKELGNMVQNRGTELVDNLKNELQSFQNGVQTSTACTKIYDEGQKAINEVTSVFYSCVSKETESASAEVQKFIDAVNNLEANITKNFQDALSCFQNPLEIFSCFSNVSQDTYKLNPEFEKVVYMLYELSGFFPNVGVCYQKAFVESIKPNAGNLLKNVQQCVTSVIPSI